MHKAHLLKGVIKSSTESPWLPKSAVFNPYISHLKTLYLNAQFRFQVCFSILIVIILGWYMSFIFIIRLSF